MNAAPRPTQQEDLYQSRKVRVCIWARHLLPRRRKYRGAEMKRPETIKKPEGKLAILLPGLGAVSTTLIAGVLLARKGLASPVGSLTQTGTIRLGKRTDNRTPRIKEFAPLAALDDIVFGSWDLFPDDALEAATTAAVLESKHVEQIKDELAKIKPMKAAFYPEYVKRLHGTHIKSGPSKADIVEQL